jgi:hypothetical protein
VGDRVRQQRERRGEQAHVEVLALSGAEPVGERGAGHAERPEGGRQVGDGAADLRRRMPGHAGERHDAAHALGDRVVASSTRVRPGLAEARHRDVDHRRVHRAHGGVAEPELVGDARQEVLDDDVGAAGQLKDELATLGLLEIDRDAALAAIDRGERRAHSVAAPGAQVVAAAGTLHLHHVGAQVGHERRAIRACDHTRKIEDADSVQHHGALSLDRGSPPSSR